MQVGELEIQPQLARRVVEPQHVGRADAQEHAEHPPTRVQLGVDLLPRARGVAPEDEEAAAGLRDGGVGAEEVVGEPEADLAGADLEGAHFPEGGAGLPEAGREGGVG